MPGAIGQRAWAELTTVAGSGGAAALLRQIEWLWPGRPERLHRQGSLAGWASLALLAAECFVVVMMAGLVELAEALARYAEL